MLISPQNLIPGIFILLCGLHFPEVTVIIICAAARIELQTSAFCLFTSLAPFMFIACLSRCP